MSRKVLLVDKPQDHISVQLDFCEFNESLGRVLVSNRAGGLCAYSSTGCHCVVCQRYVFNFDGNGAHAHTVLDDKGKGGVAVKGWVDHGG